MYGGLLKTASAAAILAAAGLFGASSAKAADLGGDCCADLEERVAELEATTVRKGNRKVSVTLSGFVAHNVMYWDDGGAQRHVHRRRRQLRLALPLRRVGQDQPDIERRLPVRVRRQCQQSAHEPDDQWRRSGCHGSIDLGPQCGGDRGAGCALRDSTVWLRHSQLGMIKVGHGSTATDNLILIDLGGMAGAGTSDVALYNGGFHPSDGPAERIADNWNMLIRGHDRSTRRVAITCCTRPRLSPASRSRRRWPRTTYWDVALRYAGELAGFRLAFGIGYLEDTEFNGSVQQNPGATDGLSSAYRWNNCSRTELKGSASILHVATGLFVTAAGCQARVERYVLAPT